ncbi:MAG: hypothetical protein AAB410_03485 [Patescibacteria group bacterium]
MGQYANIKSKRFKKVLKWLENHKGILLKKAGNHILKATAIHNGKAYPLPASHNEINKHIVKDFGEWLVENTICSKEEYDKLL